ncbi:MAG: hypothetical protein NZ528_05205 [Caldilineales bacterium]|nr:hypothetical protein [Caldilineales bacterium]MDW8318857.1 hypothetical protein [Anaerolineae bacterium]
MNRKPRPNCRFYYEDYYRGREVQECRLPRSRDSLRWQRPVCDTCPVPGILRETDCAHLALEGTIRKRFPFGERMEVFAVCTRHMVQLKDPRHCPQCAAEQAALTSDALGE